MKKLVLASFLFVPSILHADIIQISTVPSEWKLENYLNSNIVAWYAGSTCTNGRISFSGSASEEDKKIFWSTVMAAKISRQKVFVRYEDSSSTCAIVSYGLPQD